MPKKVGSLFLFFLLILLTACISIPSFIPTQPAASAETVTETGTPFLNAVPAGNGLVFFGAAAKRSNPKETLQLALEDAAKRVAVFYNVYGEYTAESIIGSGLFEYTRNTQTILYYDEKGSKQYVESLEFDADTNTIEMENTLIIRTTYAASLTAPVGYTPTYDKSGKPNWVENLPYEIDGYDVGVGYSNRYSSLADTCTNSYYNAIFAIIRNKSSSIQGASSQYQNTGSLFGYRTDTNNRICSFATLTGFYALDTWIDPKAKTVWTLAIARKD